MTPRFPASKPITLWERPEDTTARYILHRIDQAALADLGLTVSWAAKDYASHDQFKIALWTGGQDPHSVGYQVFLRVPWQSRSPEVVAEEVARSLAQPPDTWPVTFHCTDSGIDTRPPMAGPRWRREHIG